MSPGRLRRALRHLRTMGDAVGYGELFPAAGRLPVQPSPGGSHDPSPRSTPWRRARQEHAWITVSTHHLPVAGLSEAVEILHIADVHAREDDAWLKQLTRAIRAETPDLVVITGDLITRGWTPEAVDRLLGALPPARLGRWAVMGNWEHWSDAPPALWGPRLAARDVGLLVNQNVDLGPLVIAGTDDLLAGHCDVEATLGARPASRPTVVLSHSPQIFPQLVQPDVALVLSGHTHGGQLRLPLAGALWVPRGSGPYVAGWFQRGSTWLFVSRGVGWSIAPLRMWCTPEIARIRLLPAPG